MPSPRSWRIPELLQGSPGVSSRAEGPWPKPRGMRRTSCSVTSLFVLVFSFFPLPHSSRYSLLPFCFLSASYQSSSGISRGSSLASLSLHLIRRYPHLLCSCPPTWQSNLHFTGHSWVLFFLCLKWAQRVTLSTEGHTERLSSSSCGTARANSWKNTWEAYRTG